MYTGKDQELFCATGDCVCAVAVQKYGDDTAIAPMVVTLRTAFLEALARCVLNCFPYRRSHAISFAIPYGEGESEMVVGLHRRHRVEHESMQGHCVAVVGILVVGDKANERVS